MKTKFLLVLPFLFPFMSYGSSSGADCRGAAYSDPIRESASSIITEELSSTDGPNSVNDEKSIKIVMEVKSSEIITNQLIEQLQLGLGNNVKIEKVEISNVKHGTQDWTK